MRKLNKEDRTRIEESLFAGSALKLAKDEEHKVRVNFNALLRRNKSKLKKNKNSEP